MEPVESSEVARFLDANAPEAAAVLSVVNDHAIGISELDLEVGLDRRAAVNIITQRNGWDQRVGTEDDRPFRSIEELDAVKYVGETALRLLLTYAVTHDYLALPGDPSAEVDLPTRDGIRYAASVFREVMKLYSITDPGALLVRALSFDDGNGYLKREELVSAAESLRRDYETLRGYSYSMGVVKAVAAQFGIEDLVALLVAATAHDVDGNKYLNQSEILAAARGEAGSDQEVGIISDIDKTILPPYSGTTLPAPYAGVAELYRALETGRGGQPGDTHYVTARSPDRIADIPEWLSRSGLPDGPIETGIGPEPWIAEPEKIRDISAIFERRPSQSFVLFGDAGHRDPEVYREIKRRYPDRVLAVFIHGVQNIASERVSGLSLISNYEEAATQLLALGLITAEEARRVGLAVRSNPTGSDL